MAVYKKHYRGYTGPLTAGWMRFLAPVRYTFEDLNRSRFLTLFFLGSMIWPLLCAVFIWLGHNLSALKLLNIRVENFIKIDVLFFQTFLGLQSMLAFFMTAFVGPGLVSPDLANNAVPLYLARPYSRFEYVLSKMSVLMILLSLMTWVPGLGLYAFQGYLEGSSLLCAGGRGQIPGDAARIGQKTGPSPCQGNGFYSAVSGGGRQNRGQIHRFG